MKVFFRLDFGSHIGMGHLGRCQTLAENFRDLGASVGFISRPIFDLDREIHAIPTTFDFFQLSKRLHPVTRDPSSWLGVSQVQDANEVRHLVNREQVDLLVLDHYGIENLWYQEFSGASRTLTLSDYPCQAQVQDLLDYGFDATIEKHQHVTGKIFLGPSYALVGDRFAKVQAPKPSTTDPIRLLVALGGGASLDSWRSISEGLSLFLPEAIIALVPPDNLKLALQKIPETASLKFLDWAPLDLLLSQSDAAVVSAGVSMYEVLASGYPHIAVVTAQNQVASISHESTPKWLNVIRDFHQQSELKEACLALRYQCQHRALQSLKSKSTLDTWGPKRVALQYVNLDLEPYLRPFAPEDGPFLLRLANQSSVRENSFTAEPISPMSHVQWLSDGGANRQIWILRLGAVPIGQCRIEEQNGVSYLHYSIDEDFRSRGFGKKMLNLLMDHYRPATELRAKVLVKNTASVNALGSVGFKLVHQEGVMLEMALFQ